MKYSHAFDFSFEVTSRKADGSDVTPRMMAREIRKRVKEIMSENGGKELLDACNLFDTMRVDD